VGGTANVAVGAEEPGLGRDCAPGTVAVVLGVVTAIVTLGYRTKAAEAETVRALQEAQERATTCDCSNTSARSG
jgi:hypothetical protein